VTLFQARPLTIPGARNFSIHKAYGASGSQENGGRKMLNLLSDIALILAIWVVVVILVPNKRG
jgi:hypothetical protein